MKLRRHSYKLPVSLFVIVLLLTITLTVLWNVVLAHDYIRIRELAASEAQRTGPFHTTFIVLGSSLFLLIIVLVSILGAQTFAAIRWGRRQENFLASVSHELNSPLQSIKLYAQTLQRQDVDEEHRQQFLATMLEEAARLQALIGNTLRAAQIDQRRLPVHRERVALRDLLAHHVERITAIAAHGGPRDISLAPGVDCWVELDRALFRQLLDNLVDNAIKYSPADCCHIELSLDAAPRAPLVLRVRDHGIGLPRGQQRRIFERFYRIEDDDPVRSRKGTGLGLSIVRSIAEAHGWRVWADSDGPGAGTTVHVEIPEYELLASGDSEGADGGEAA